MLVIIVFPGLFKPKKIEVPDVSNLELKLAIEELEANGFTIGEQTLEFSEEVEEDHVIRTTPEAGKMRDKETEIHLFVSSGKETSAIGNYVGDDIEQVRRLLQNQVLDIEVEERFDSEPVGTILEQTPVGGTEIIPNETELQFVVSKGPDLRTVNDLTNYNEKALKDTEKSSGFKIKIAGRRIP